jgi:hypothetical protein
MLTVSLRWPLNEASVDPTDALNVKGRTTSNEKEKPQLYQGIRILELFKITYGAEDIGTFVYFASEGSRRAKREYESVLGRFDKLKIIESMGEVWVPKPAISLNGGQFTFLLKGMLLGTGLFAVGHDSVIGCIVVASWQTAIGQGFAKKFCESSRI